MTDVNIEVSKDACMARQKSLLRVVFYYKMYNVPHICLEIKTTVTQSMYYIFELTSCKFRAKTTQKLITPNTVI